MIGIFGGTFDPIHYGHLRSALDVMQAVGLEEVRFIPLHGAVHRDQPQVPARLRMQMVEAAIAEQSGFVTDDRELQRAGHSYSVDTLTELHQLFPEKPLCLMMGLDAFNGFSHWHRPDEILRLAHLIVMQRPGEGEVSIASKKLLLERQCHEVSEMKQRQAGAILLQTFTQLDISSTQIRTLLVQGVSPRYLLPEAVLDIIQANGLYLVS